MGNRGFKGAREMWRSDGYERRDWKLPKVVDYICHVKYPVHVFCPGMNPVFTSMIDFPVAAETSSGIRDEGGRDAGNAEVMHVRLTCESGRPPAMLKKVILPEGRNIINI